MIAAAVLLASACGPGETEDTNGKKKLDVIVDADPAVLATFEPWEASCVLWLRADCRKSVECTKPVDDDCTQDDKALRDKCDDLAANSDPPCADPEPASFDDCRSRTENETCTEYCDGNFCFDFCFFTCLS